VLIRGVGLNPTRTGLLVALQAMGADLFITEGQAQAGEPVGDVLVRHSPLIRTNVHGSLVVRMIDEFPIFGVLAAYARGVTAVHDARELRLKESDRIASLCEALDALGVRGEARPDGFKVSGGTRPTGGHLRIAQDHRLAMALAVAGLDAQTPVVLQGAEILSQSYPGFVEAMKGLGADMVWVDE
jgi:3-phosphoshikimate 1-carboxyvinyltransferase